MQRGLPRHERELPMEEQEFLFFRGSTPTLELVLPLAVGAQDVVFLTFSQGGQAVVEYAINGQPDPAGTGVLARDDAEENVLLLTMTQADTLRLEPGDTELQLRLKNSVGADTFRPLIGRIGPARKEGVLT